MLRVLTTANFKLHPRALVMQQLGTDENNQTQITAVNRRESQTQIHGANLVFVLSVCFYKDAKKYSGEKRQPL